jgi:hypothetical protein
MLVLLERCLVELELPLLEERAEGHVRREDPEQHVAREHPRPGVQT